MATSEQAVMSVMASPEEAAISVMASQEEAVIKASPVALEEFPFSHPTIFTCILLHCNPRWVVTSPQSWPSTHLVPMSYVPCLQFYVLFLFHLVIQIYILNKPPEIL